MEMESRTVVGAFPTFSDAQRAADSLYQAGFSRVRIARNDLEGAAAASHHEEHPKSGIGGFFSRLFGHDDQRPAWKLHSDSEAYFQDQYYRKYHLVIVEKCHDPIRCREMIGTLGGTVEDQGSHYYESELQRNLESPSGAGISQRVDRSEPEEVMELHEEVVDVHVDRRQTGEVRVRKDIITEIKTVEVPVTREEIVVERRTLDEGAPLRAEPMEEIHIPVSEEQIHIGKTVVPREEVRVSKERVTEIESVPIDVSHEEARMESQGQVKIQSEKPKTPYRPGLREDDSRPSV